MNTTPDPEETEREALAKLIAQEFDALGVSGIGDSDWLTVADAVLAARRVSESEEITQLRAELADAQRKWHHFDNQAFLWKKRVAEITQAAGLSESEIRRELTVRPNPPMPSEQDLLYMYLHGGVKAVWRAGCDAGMVAE